MSLLLSLSFLIGFQASADPLSTYHQPRRVVADYLADGLLKATGVPGMSTTVIIGGNKIWDGPAGLRDVEEGLPVETDTRFRLASVSKLFAASATARLALDGHLELDAPIDRYLDNAPSHWADISVRDLAAHISGIPHYQEQDSDRGAIRYRSVNDALSVVRDRPLLFDPGTDYHYSTYGYTVLSAVIEAASNEPYLDYLDNMFFDSIGADSLGAEDFSINDPRMTKLYERGQQPRQIQPRDYSYSWAGAGMRGTATDLALFGAAHLSGAIMDAEAFNSILVPTTLDNGATVGRYYFRVGLGWRISESFEGRRIAHHAGITPGARSALVVFPDHNTSVAILSNASWIAQIERTAAMFGAIFLSEGFPSEPDCPNRSISLVGHFDDAMSSAELIMDWRNGVCVGFIKPGGAFLEWQNQFSTQPLGALHAAAITTDKDGITLAIAGSTGLFEARLSTIGDSQTLRATLGESTLLDLRTH